MRKNWQDMVAPESSKTAAAFLADPCSPDVHVLPGAFGEPKEMTNLIFLARLLMEAQDILQNGDSQISEHGITSATCDSILQFTNALKNLAQGKPVDGFVARVAAFETAINTLASYYVKKIFNSRNTLRKVEAEVQKIACMDVDHGTCQATKDPYKTLTLLAERSPEFWQHELEGEMLGAQTGRTQRALAALKKFVDDVRAPLKALSPGISPHS